MTWVNEKNVKILNKIFENWIQVRIQTIIHHKQVAFLPEEDDSPYVK